MQARCDASLLHALHGAAASLPAGRAFDSLARAISHCACVLISACVQGWEVVFMGDSLTERLRGSRAMG